MKSRCLVIFPLAAFLLLLSGVDGCKKNDDAVDPSSTAYLTEDDAADAFANVLAGGQGTCGFTAQVEEAATVAAGTVIPKTSTTASTLFDTTVTRQRNGTYSYNYLFHYSYGLAAANRFAFSYTMKGMYETPRMSSADSAAASLEVTNLLAGQTYTVVALYNRYGSQISKVRNKVSFRSTITISITDLLVDKTTKRITGGNATVSMSGQTSSARAYAFAGTVTFLGAQQATLVINGRTFILDLALGTVTATGTA
jgi:hypothetical protein